MQCHQLLQPLAVVCSQNFEMNKERCIAMMHHQYSLNKTKIKKTNNFSTITNSTHTQMIWHLKTFVHTVLCVDYFQDLHKFQLSIIFSII